MTHETHFERDFLENCIVQEALKINVCNFRYLTCAVSSSFIAMFFLPCHNYTPAVLREGSPLACYSFVLGY